MRIGLMQRLQQLVGCPQRGRRESPGFVLASENRSASVTHASRNPGFAPRLFRTQDAETAAAIVHRNN